jgi:hypothetical protein
MVTRDPLNMAKWSKGENYHISEVELIAFVYKCG